jgi:hypothetical protein
MKLGVPNSAKVSVQQQEYKMAYGPERQDGRPRPGKHRSFRRWLIIASTLLIALSVGVTASVIALTLSGSRHATPVASRFRDAKPISCTGSIDEAPSHPRVTTFLTYSFTCGGTSLQQPAAVRVTSDREGGITTLSLKLLRSR